MIRAGASSLAALALSACVTTTLDEPPIEARAIPLQTAVVIPFDGASGNSGPVDQYYSSILQQMQEALGGRDLNQLNGLLAGHDRDNAPSWARERIARFQTAALGLEFEAHAAEHSRIEVVYPGRILGEAVDFVFELDTPSNHDVLLEDTRRSGLRFLATLSVVDHDAYGGRTTRTASRTLRLRKPLTRHMQHPSEATFKAAADPTSAVLRELNVVVELLPGTVQIDDELAPIQRMKLAETTEIFYPTGTDVIREKPMATLRGALALGDPKHFPHQYLSAHFMPEEQRDEAIEMFVENVRLGNAAQARVAMACLVVLTGEEIRWEIEKPGWLGGRVGRAPSRRLHLSRKCSMAFHRSSYLRSSAKSGLCSKSWQATQVSTPLLFMETVSSSMCLLPGP